MSGAGSEVDIEAHWEHGDPVASERRFREAVAALEGAEGVAALATRLELLTQVARTLSLRRRFDEAHAVLDEVERGLAEGTAAPTAGEPAPASSDPYLRPRVRLLLERGRSFSSAGERDRARSLFAEAWTLAGDAVGAGVAPGGEAPGGGAPDGPIAGLAVDAAHMIAITHAGSDAAIEWNRRGLELARRSRDAKARALVPAMLNNAAWDLHDLGRFDEALAFFEEALAEWANRGREPQIRIARWSVARCLRSLGRHEAALELLRGLEEEPSCGTRAGFVFEEIAENLDSLGRRAEAAPCFRRAAADLAQDEQLAAQEPARLARMRERGSAG